MSRQRWPVYALLLLTGVLVLASVGLGVLNGSQVVTSDWGTVNVAYALALSALAYPLAGALIALRRPGNAVGWICLGIGAALGFTTFVGEYARYALLTSPGSLPGGLIAAWADNWLWITFVFPLGVFLPLLFPDGHLPSRRWRAVAVIGCGGAFFMAASGAFDPVLVNFPGLENPFGVTGLGWLESSLLLMPLSFVAAAASVVVRFRRSSEVERLQLKWFVYAVSVLALGTIIAVTVPLGSEEASRVAADVATLLFAALPLATGIAILRHRLYDIDRLINKTIVYGAVTALLATGYLTAVLVFQAVLPVADDSPAVVAASTLAVVALFRPLRRRIQGLVDRRFYRHRFDASLTIERFASRLRSETDLDSLTSDLISVVGSTMQPRHVSLWISPERETL